MRSLRWLHVWTGLIASVMVVILSVTGILLVHRKDLKLNQVMLPVLQSSAPSDIDGWSGAALSNGSMIVAARQGVFLRDADEWRLIIPEQGRIVALNAHRIWVGTREGLYVSEDQGENWHQTGASGDIRAITLDREAGYAASGTALYRIHGRETSELLRLPKGVTEVRQILTGGGRITLIAKSGILVIDEDGIFQNVSPHVTGTRHAELQKLVTDLHSGTLFGKWFAVVVDAAAVSMIFLTVSGLGLYVIPRRKRRELKLKCQDTMPDNC